MVGAVVHEPRDAARDDQLGHADHRPAGAGAGAGDQPARARVGDPRLHDRLDGARAHVRAPVRPVRPQARVRPRLRRVRARIARRGLLGGRGAADPVADPAGRRRGVPVRELVRARHRRVPARAARRRDGHERDGRRGRPRDRSGARRRARGDLVAVGLLVQRPARARRLAVGRPDPARAGEAGQRARLRPARHAHVRRRPDRARVRDLARRAVRLGRPRGDRRAWPPPSCCCRCSC